MDARPRRFGGPWARRFVPGTVVIAWLVAVTALGLWARVAEGAAAAVTMVFGSLVAGSTPQGGGAVAFPVFTKVLEVPAAAARTFSLSIQAMGMGTAAILIVMRRLPVAWRAVRVIAGAASVSFLVGLVVLTEDGPFRPSVVSDDVTKVGFTVVVAALAVLTMRLRHVDLHRTDVELDAVALRALVLTGVVGGALSALLGSGADVVAFLALTLLFGVRPGVAVPSSVVVMAVVSVLGLLSLGLADGQLLTATPGLDLPALWLAAVPVVVVGAPVGSWLASRAGDRVLLGVVITLAVVEVVTTVVFLDRLRMDPGLVLLAIVGAVLAVRTLWSMHRRRWGPPAARPIGGTIPTPQSPSPSVPARAVRPTPYPPPARGHVPRAVPSLDHDQGAAPVPAAADHNVLVGGVRSRSGHLNHPGARYCHRTGQRLEGRPGQATTGPRPALGILCTDDGDSHPLTVDLVIGREPHRHHLVTDADAAPLELGDASGALSRAHLLVTLRGWDIRVADLGSSNGSWLRTQGSESWERLAPGEAVTVPSGAMVACGDRRLRIDHLYVR